MERCDTGADEEVVKDEGKIGRWRRRRRRKKRRKKRRRKRK